MKRLVLVVMMAAAMAVAPRAVEAAVLQIQVTGLDLVYTGDATGGTVCDATSCLGAAGNPADSDAVVNMDFFVDGVLIGTLSSNIWVDTTFSLTEGLAADGSFTAIGAGHFDLLTSAAGWGLALDISGGQVVYNDFGAFFSFNGVTSGSIFAQDLPFGLAIDTPVLVTFSTNGPIGGTVVDGFVTAFAVSGSPDITGAAAVVPEPGSLLLLGTGLLFAASRIRRRLR